MTYGAGVWISASQTSNAGLAFSFDGTTGRIAAHSHDNLCILRLSVMVYLLLLGVQLWQHHQQMDGALGPIEHYLPQYILEYIMESHLVMELSHQLILSAHQLQP
jgi:hypothetical protein